MPQKQTILVVGANRGIGFELASRFLDRGNIVYGTCRPQTTGDPSVALLREKGAKILEVDYLDEETINLAAEKFGNQSLDILINCAGLYYLWDDKPFSDQSAEDLVSHFKVNVVGPFLASKAFLPALSRATLGKIINISSDFASITDNTGGNACYRISKAALNQLTKNMAADLGKLENTSVETLAVHPGYVATKMTGYYGEDDMQTCMDSLVSVIERFGTKSGQDLPNGGYVRWNGELMKY